jgi:GTP-binding protein HflX
VLNAMAKDGALDDGFADRTIEVLNKSDLLGGVEAVELRPGALAVSALTGAGFAALLEALDTRLAAAMQASDYAIPHADGARLAWLYAHGEVTARDETDEGTLVTVRLLPADRARFERAGFEP